MMYEVQQVGTRLVVGLSVLKILVNIWTSAFL